MAVDATLNTALQAIVDLIGHARGGYIERGGHVGIWHIQVHAHRESRSYRYRAIVLSLAQLHHMIA
jgi:hypothetical protein